MVDDLSNGKKYHNISNLNISDYLDYQEFIDSVNKNQSLKGVKCIFHQGACTDTTEWDGRYMMKTTSLFQKLLHASTRVMFGSFMPHRQQFMDLQKISMSTRIMKILSMSMAIQNYCLINIRNIKIKGAPDCRTSIFQCLRSRRKFKKSMVCNSSFQFTKKMVSLICLRVHMVMRMVSNDVILFL